MPLKGEGLERTAAGRDRDVSGRRMGRVSMGVLAVPAFGRCAFAWATPALGRPLRGNAGCARCAFAWATPALGALRCNPGDSGAAEPGRA